LLACFATKASEKASNINAFILILWGV